MEVQQQERKRKLKLVCKTCQQVNKFQEEKEINDWGRDFGLEGILLCLKENEIGLKEKVKGPNCSNVECGRSGKYYCETGSFF